MVGSVVGGIFGAIAGDKQADAVEDAADKSAEVQRYMFDESVRLSEPWRTGGSNALEALQYELGLGGTERPTLGETTRFRVGDETFDTREEAEEFLNGLPSSRGGQVGAASGGPFLPEGMYFHTDPRDPLRATLRRRPPGYIGPNAAGSGGGGAGDGDGGPPEIEEFTEGGQQYLGFQKTPGYEFQLDEGQRAINRSLAARGRALSGPAVKEGMRFSQGLADQTYSNHLARLANLSGLGGGVAQTQGGFAMQTGQGIGGTMMRGGINAGNARASGFSALGQGISSGINSLGQFAGQSGFGAGSSPFGSFGSFLSDRRVKTDVHRVGETAEGYPKYEFRYLWDEPGTVRVGVMADEVDPVLVSEVNGYQVVDYSGVTL